MPTTQAFARGGSVVHLEAAGEPLPAARRAAWERIHGAVVPADVRAGDPIAAHLRPAGSAGSARPTPWQVWRISPLGVELVRPQGAAELREGAPVDLTLRVGECVSDFRALPVLVTERDRGRDLVALSWAAAAGCRGEAEQRARTRWACGPDYAPTGIAPSAVRYGDFVYFRVVDVSGEGMQLETSLRNKYLLPGVTLDATCTFPTLGQLRLDLRVVHARVVQRGGRARLSLGVRYAARDARAASLIGQYLLQFGAGATVQDLRAGGLRIPSSSRALDFCSVRSAEEYQEVLRLRRLAYQQAGKVAATARDADMGDGLDARSRILVAKHQGRIVGTVRLMFPQGLADPLKHEEFLPLPPDLPPRDQLVELSKAATHPGYRGSDLFYTLIKHAALVAVQAGRRWALMSATDALAPVYLRFGLRPTGATYVHPTMKLRHHLMIADIPRVVSGRGIHPLFWNLMDGYEVWSHARRCGALEDDAWLAARVQLLRLLRPAAALARWLYGRRLAARGGAR